MKTDIRRSSFLLVLTCLFLVNCRSQVKDEKKVPEKNTESIENSAEPVDPLLQYQSPPVISDEKKDSLIIKSDSI